MATSRCVQSLPLVSLLTPSAGLDGWTVRRYATTSCRRISLASGGVRKLLRSRPALRVDGALRRLTLDDGVDLPHGFQRLIFDRLRQPTDMRRGDDVWKFCEFRRRHLIGCATDIHCGTRD